jgi:serine phosphatase RsbU (regulator of sigma subunit)
VEVALAPGLPLGLVTAADYDETRFRLEPDEQLTLMTDGVVESRAPGGELYGFDRTLAISAQTANTIAQAAQSFGQDDDITVITLARTV